MIAKRESRVCGQGCARPYGHLGYHMGAAEWAEEQENQARVRELAVAREERELTLRIVFRELMAAGHISLAYDIQAAVRNYNGEKLDPIPPREAQQLCTSTWWAEECEKPWGHAGPHKGAHSLWTSDQDDTHRAMDQGEGPPPVCVGCSRQGAWSFKLGAWRLRHEDGCPYSTTYAVKNP